MLHFSLRSAVAAMAVGVCVSARETVFDAVEGCDGDNWGMPLQTRQPYRKTYAEDIQQFCANTFSDMPPMSESLDNAMINHYNDNNDFDNFAGQDWVPENHHMFAKISPWGSRLDVDSYEPQSMKGAVCENQLPDGSTWTVTRVGPFRTTGGFDWVQVGWDNLWDMREKLKKYPDGVYLLDQFSSPVLEDGTRLGNPPIHVHHIHIGPAPGVRQRAMSYGCLFDDNRCYDATRVCEHHGDYQCTEADGGLDCFVESMPDGYGKLITFELGLEGDLNDGRVAGSPVLEWYYELGVRWIPKNGPPNSVGPIKAMSFHNFAGPGVFDKQKQATYIFTYPSPTDQESIFWYTGRMKHGGKMLRNKQHAHGLIFTESLFFSATPEELGLTVENNLAGPRSDSVILTKAAGFNSNNDLKTFILNQLENSRLHNKASDYNGRNGRLPKTVCQSVDSSVVHEGYIFDRREPTCCTEWDFNDGEVFTVVGFNVPLKGMMRNMKEKPPTFPGHIGYWISYDTQEPEEKSHFSITMYSNDPDNQFSPEVLKSMNFKVKMLLFGGTPDTGFTIWLVAAVLSLSFIRKHIFVAVFMWSFAGYRLFSYLKSRSKRQRLRAKICSLNSTILSSPIHEL